MRSQERSCEKKVRYLDRTTAKKARTQLRSSGKSDGRVQAYICDYCGFFHLGHIPQGVRSGRVDKAEWRDG